MSRDAEVLCPPAPHVLLSADHPLAARASLKLADVADLPMILLDYPSVRVAVAAFFKRNGLKPLIRLQSPSFAMVRGLVAQGLGYSIVPQSPWSKAGRDGPEVKAVPLDEDFPEGAVIAVTQRPDLQSRLARDFIAKCRTSFRPAPHGEGTPTDEEARR
jgi:DNA-binding transcriptional LysR family regulator